MTNRFCNRTVVFVALCVFSVLDLGAADKDVFSPNKHLFCGRRGNRVHAKRDSQSQYTESGG